MGRLGGAIHGELLKAQRPSRAAAAVTRQRIDAALADARAGIWDVGASVKHSFARAALGTVTASTANTRHDSTRIHNITVFRRADGSFDLLQRD